MAKRNRISVGLLSGNIERKIKGGTGEELERRSEAPIGGEEIRDGNIRRISGASHYLTSVQSA